MKGLLDMTRRERRGTIVLLAVIAVMLLAAVAARYHHEDIVVDSVNTSAINRFEAETDSVSVQEPKHKHHAPEHKTTQKRPKRGSRPKPSHEPRPIDPVPNF